MISQVPRIRMLSAVLDRVLVSTYNELESRSTRFQNVNLIPKEKKRIRVVLFQEL